MSARVVSIGLLATVLTLSGTAPSAQAIHPVPIADDQVLGWIKIYDYKGATLPITQDQRVYSRAQLSIAQVFANWMQASYLPTGALGDVVQIRNEKLGLYNKNTAALPQSYGAYAKLYDQLKYDANKKLTPLTNDHTVWTIEANGFYGTPTDALNTPTQYFFTFPSFEEQGFGTELDKAADVSRHPVLGQFPTVFVRDSVTGNRRIVFLSKDHKLPFIKVTKGEYLRATEEAMVREYNAEKQKIAREDAGNQKGIDLFTGFLNTKNDKRVATLKSNKERYKDRLQEPAEIFTLQPDVLLENYADVFEGNGGRRLKLPVYKVDPAKAELAKTDTPQWIVMTWTAQLNDRVSRSLHNAILTNVDFEYIYNYFFDPDKVKGQPYKPLRSPSFVEPVAALGPSEVARKAAADSTVHFFDDFSSSAVGKKPLNWRSSLDNTGGSSVVVQLPGVDGHWALISGFELAPTAIKTPLPRDFELSYDVIAAQNYAWGAHGMTFRLSRKAAAGARESFVSLRVRPGFGGRQGEVLVEAEFPGAQGYLEGSKYVGAPGFSNDAVNNRITVTLKKKGELLQVFVDKTKVAEYEKGMPAGLQFDAMSFQLAGVAATDKMFIGNIRIAAN